MKTDYKKDLEKTLKYLDAKDERLKCIESLKDKILNLLIERYEIDLGYANNSNTEEDDKRCKEIHDEIAWRILDYQCFAYDYKEDWDLCYNDYLII